MDKFDNNKTSGLVRLRSKSDTQEHKMCDIYHTSHFFCSHVSIQLHVRYSSCRLNFLFLYPSTYRLQFRVDDGPRPFHRSNDEVHIPRVERGGVQLELDGGAIVLAGHSGGGRSRQK